MKQPKTNDSDPSLELVVIVDRDNRITGATPRWKMRRDRLIHRASFIIVFRPGGRLLVQKRTLDKDIYPGLLEIAAGGVVRHGETYKISALRELQEETGITGIDLNFHFDFYFEDDSNRVWGRIFSCIWDGDIKPQKEEVEWGRFLGQDEIEEGITRGKFTPDSEYLYWLAKERGIIPDYAPRAEKRQSL